MNTSPGPVPAPLGGPSGASGSGWAPVRDDEVVLIEALSKSGVIWLVTKSGSHARWHAPLGALTHIVAGPDEQALPELPAQLDLVVPSKESGAALLRVPAHLAPLDQDTPAWEEAARALASKRLNSAHLPADLMEHWRETATIYQISPRGAALVLWGHAPAHTPREQQTVSAQDAPGAAITTTLPSHLRGRGPRRKKGRSTRS